MNSLRSLLVAVLLVAGLASPALADPKVRVTFRPKTGAITAVAFRPDGKQLAIGTESGMLKVKDLSGGDAGSTILNNTAGWLTYTPLIYNTHSGPRPVFGSLIAISPGGLFQVFYADNYENQTGGDLGNVNGSGVPLASLSGNGRYLACSMGGQDVYIGRPAEWKKNSWQAQGTSWWGNKMGRADGVVGNVVSLAMNNDGSLLAVAYRSAQGRGAVALFDRPRGQSMKVRELDFAPTAVAYSPKGTALLAVGKGRVWVGGPRGENGRIMPAPQSPVVSVAFSPSERWAAAACSDGNIYLWDVKAKRARFKVKAHDGMVTCLGWSSDSKSFATGGRDGCAKVWDLDDQ